MLLAQLEQLLRLEFAVENVGAASQCLQRVYQVSEQLRLADLEVFTSMT
jgi:Asp-tRNA(Asn)/Glu-tRNA(Gln) amidotransferase C subunit